MITTISNPIERRRFFRFLVVGAIGAIVDFGTMNLLVKLLSLRLTWAGTISFIAAVISNFTWNRYWTYPDSRSKPIIQQLGEFAVVSVIGLMIRIPILAFIDPFLYKLIPRFLIELRPIDLKYISHNITLALAVIVVLFWNFFVNRYWTYGDIS